MFSSTDQLERSCPRVKITFQASATRLSGKVLLWLLHNLKNGGGMGKEKAMDAIVAFWLPFALAEQEQHLPDEVQEAARLAIRRLEEQIWHLRSCFGIEINPPIYAVMAEAAKQPKTEVEKKSEPLTSLSELTGEVLNSQNLEPMFQIQACNWEFDETALGEAA